MKTKDILFLLQFFYPEYISSATLPFDTALRLREEGYSIDVLCGYPHEYIDGEEVSLKETVEGINIHRVKYLQLDRKNFFGRIVNYLSLTVAMFFRIFSMRRYKAIMVYSNPPILPLVAVVASKIFKCKLIFIAYDLYPEIAIKTNTISENGIIAKIMNCINKLVYKQSSAVVALSTEMKEYMIRNRTIDAVKVHTIPNWYKDEYCGERNSEENSVESLVKGRFAVGYFGNMGMAQDMESIKDAIRYYKNAPDVCFLLSGHGSKYSDVKKMIDDEQIENAYLFEFLKGQEYINVLQASSCAIVSLEKGLTGLCVPSKTYGYMMQGLPIIAIIDESDIAHDIQKGAGYHVIGNSGVELINIIQEAKTSPEICKMKGETSRRLYLENYAPHICLDKYVRLVKAILMK